MGGKTWSKEEEDVYWLKLIPHSPKRLGGDLKKNKEESWNWVALQMTKIMGERARRDYTSLGVFEHYFQNCCLKHFSPNIRKLHAKYCKHEQRVKRKKEAAAQAAQAAEAAAAASQATEEATAAAQALEKMAAKDDEDTEAVNADILAAGTQNAPAVIENCQYPRPPAARLAARPSSRDPTGAPIAPRPPNFYIGQLPANRDRLNTTESEEDGLFVSQSATPWAAV